MRGIGDGCARDFFTDVEEYMAVVAMSILGVSRKFFRTALLAIAGLSLSAMASGQATVVPSALSFGSVAENQVSATKTVTFKNTGAASITVSSVAVSGNSDYAVNASATTCVSGLPLAKNATCAVGVTLTPSALGARTGGSVVITSSASNSPQSVTLSGTGVLPVTLAPASAAFGAVVVNTTSTAKTLVLTNNQSGILQITNSILAAPFSLDTSATTTCPIAGGVLSGSLNPNSSCVVGVLYSPTAVGNSTGKITILDSAPNSPQYSALTGSGIAPTKLSATSIAFGNVVQNTTSSASTITLTNNQSVALNFTSIAAPAPYSVDAATTTCAVGTPLAPATSCVIGVKVTPTTLGLQAAANLAITDDASNSPQLVALKSTGVLSVTITPASVAFGAMVDGTTATQTFTIKNNLPTAVTLQSVTGFAAPYSLDSTNTTCLLPGTLAANTSCTVSVQIAPTATGSFTGTLSVAYAAAGSPQSVALSASSIQPVKLSKTSLTFNSHMVGDTTNIQTLSITLTNQQSVDLDITSAGFTGTNPNDFKVVSLCPLDPNKLGAGKSCTLQVSFLPKATGTRSATLNIYDDALGQPQTVTVTGPGAPPVSVTPSSITNYKTNVGTTSAFQTVTIKNNQSISLNITGLLYSGDFQQTSTTCGSLPAVLAAGASCKLTVSFAPVVGGIRNGQLQVYDDAGTSPQAVNLSGAGTAPLTIAPVSLTFPAQMLGTISGSKTIVLTNHETQPETFSLVTAGNFKASSSCAGGVIPANIPGNTPTCNIYVSFAPDAGATAGPLTGSLTINNSAANGSVAAGGSPLSLPLTGSASTKNPPAAVATVSPAAGAAGTSVTVMITGNGWTHFASNSVISFVDTNSSKYAAGITVSSFTVLNNNQIQATLQLDGSASVVYGARNIYVKTPVSGSSTPESAYLNSAFIIADPNQSHTITSMVPSVSTQGASLNVNITAAGTHFVQGTTYANFGAGITVNSLSIIDATDAQANITISPTTPVGPRTVTMMTAGEYAVSSGTFQVNASNAALVSVAPNSEGQGWSGSVNLTASNTHFVQGATTASIGGGVTVGSVNVLSSTTAVAQVIVPATASVGLQDVTVATGGEISTLHNAFTVTSTTPYLSSVAPASGVQGQLHELVVIQGVNTNFVAGQVSANFTGEITVNSVTVNSTSKVTVDISISQYANAGSITAYLVSGPTGNITSFPFTFSVTSSTAAILSVTPNSVPQGGQVTLSVVGANTNWSSQTTNAAFYPTSVPTPSFDLIAVSDATHAQLNVVVPTNTPPGDYGFYMQTGGQVVNATIHVYAFTPTLTMSPANGLQGTSLSVTFTGQNTHFNSSTFAVIDGEGVTLQGFHVSSPNSATAKVVIDPTAAVGLRTITLTTGGEIVTTQFNVSTATLVSINPYHAAQSTTLNVEIVGRYTHFVQGTTSVLFGPEITVNSLTVKSATDLVANITTTYSNAGTPTPTQPGWQAVYVTTGTEQLLTGFGVDPPAVPTIVSVSPSSAAQGSSTNVTITGSLTSWSAAQTEAILGAGVTVSNLTVTGPTSATAIIAVSPTAPVGGNSVVMITGSEIESSTAFSVTPGTALINGVGPSVTCNANEFAALAVNCGISNGSGTPYIVQQLHTASLSFTGVGTHWLQGETTVSFGPGVAIDALTINSPTSATVQITVLSSSPVGFVPLTTYTDGEVVTLQQAIDIEEGFPKLIASAPGSQIQGNTFNLQLLGRFTSWTQGVTNVTFNNQDVTVNSVNVIDAQNLIANVTVSPWAYIDGSPCGHVATVTTGTEQVIGSTVAPGEPGILCVAKGPASISSVTPLESPQGSTLVLTLVGANSNFVAGVTTVSFDDPNFKSGQITVVDKTHLSLPVGISTTATTGYKTVTVQTYGEVASQIYSFTVDHGVGTLNEAIPNQAEQGVQNLTVRLLGQYTHFSSQTTATYGTGITVNSIALISTTEVDANISIDPLSYTGGRTVTVTTPNVPCNELAGANACPGGATTGTGSEIVSVNGFTVIAGPAIISSVSPNTGNQGQEVIFDVTGVDTHWQQNFTQFYIAGGGSDITINSVVINSATSATVDVSISETANPSPRSIYMVTAGESLVDSNSFVVTGGIPVITYLSPNYATVGDKQVEVTINGLLTQWDNTTTLNFGPGVTVSAYQVEDSTHITALVNIDAAAQVGYRTVQVVTGLQILTSNFNVLAVPPTPTPYISYFWPSSGLTGQTLTVHFAGANTHWDPGPINTATVPTFGDGISVNTFQVLGPTQAIANITIDPSTYSGNRLFVLATGSEAESATFNVISSTPGGPDSVTPVISIVDPSSAMQGTKNFDVNVLGQYTTFDASTVFNFGAGVTVNSVTVLGSTIATVNIGVDQLATIGGRSVTALEGTTTVYGGYFYVSPSQARVAAVTPNTAKQGDTITVDVTGLNTHWTAATNFSFGAGIVVTSTTVNTATDATLTLAIPALASEGPTWVTATTLGEVANLNNAFVVQPGTPMLLSSGPGSLPQQSSAIFTILSQATTWSAANPPTVSYGDGATVSNVIVTSPTSMTANGFITPTTATGWRNLTVTTGSQILNLNNALYVNAGPAVINSVTPASGGQAATLDVVINGTNTHWVQGTTILNFPNVLVNSYTVTSPTTIKANITVNINAPAGQVAVTATTLGEVAVENNAFTVIQTQPELLAVVATSAAQGVTTNVTLTGQFTHFTQGTTTANFGTGIAVNSVTVLGLTSLQANITIQPTTTLGARNVSVTTGSEIIALNNAFSVTVGPAAIIGLNAANGAQGSSYTIQITGSQTHFASGVTTASFGGGIQVTGLTVTDLLHATAQITIPAGVSLGSYNVTLTTAGETATILGGFTVTNGTPTLMSVNPATGHQGDTKIAVEVTGQFTHFVNVTSTASFGAGITVNTFQVNSATDATATITIDPVATIATRTVTVTTGSETESLANGFSVLAGVPKLVSATPATGQAGTSGNLVITGLFTSFVQGQTSVSLGSGITVTSTNVSTSTQVSVGYTIDIGATVGTRSISVTTNGQTQTLNNAFTVTAGVPVVLVISPNIGVPNSTKTVTLTGQFTNWVQGTTKVSLGAGVAVGSGAEGAASLVTVSSATSLNFTANIDPAATLGPRDVVVTTGAEVETVAGGFTVQSTSVSAPSLISVSPEPGYGTMPINSYITLVFSQPMDRTTFVPANITFELTSNQGQGYLNAPFTVTVDASGRVATITPTSLLAVNASYYLALNGIKDASENSFSYWGQTFYTDSAPNSTPPSVVAANPLAGLMVGTNVPIQVEFNVPMNLSTLSGITVSSGGTPVAGTWSWNTNNSCPVCGYGPENALYFTPTTALSPSTTYKVAWAAPLADTAGNVVNSGSFTFTTGTGPDTATNTQGLGFVNGMANLGTNFAPSVTFSKPVNPLDINSSTIYLYNADSSKYVNGAVTVAANGLSAVFKPTALLLPYTEYHLHTACGNYDVDGNSECGPDATFSTGSGNDATAPTVVSISPANSATAVPLNSIVVVHLDSPINPATISGAIQLVPVGGSAVTGTTTLSSDQLTLTFAPNGPLQGSTVYNVQVSGYQDMVGNNATPFTSSFTTAASAAVLNVSTGLDASGNLITTGDTPDAHWMVIPTSSEPGGGNDNTFTATGTSQPLKVVASNNTDWYSSWPANGNGSSWVAINPDSATGNTYGVYYTTFNIAGASVPANLCLTGQVGVDDNMALGLNGTAITGNISAIYSLGTINIPISSYLTTGSNTLAVGWGSTDNSLEAFRLHAVVATCGAEASGGLSLSSVIPANNATGVAVNTPVTLVFNQPLDPATVNSGTLELTDGWGPGQQVVGGLYAVSGNTVTFTPNAPLPTSTTFYLVSCNGPTDLVGDIYGSCWNQISSFTTGSTAIAPSQAFQVVAFTPASGATQVGLRAPVTATFNRSVNPNTINTGDAALFAGDGQSPWCTSYTRSQDNQTLSFNCYALPASTTLTAELNPGLQDWQGNALVNFTSSFTTTYWDSNSGGSIVSSRPGNGAGGVSTSSPLTLFTNLPINSATAQNGIQVAVNDVLITGTATVIDGGYALEYTPTSTIPAGALVQWWTTSTLSDTAYQNSFNTTSGYYYTAADTSAASPTAQVVSPANGNYSVPLNADFSVQFNTPIDGTTIIPSNIYVRDGNSGLNVPVTYAQPLPNVVRMTPTAPLVANHYEYIYVTSGLHSSTSVAATANGWYSYTTTAQDTTLPVITATVPYNGAVNVGVNAQVMVRFSKAIDPTTVNSTTFQVLNGGSSLAGSFWFSSDDTTVKFTPTAPLPASKTLAVQINGVADIEGHTVAQSNSFTTAATPDFTSPSVVWSSVASGESIPTNSIITVQFSEPMDTTTLTAGQPSGCNNFYIEDTLTGQCIATTLTWSADQSTAYLAPAAPLSAGRAYYLYVYGGADLSGNSLNGTSLTFYAQFGSSSTVPTVQSFNPIAGATGVGTNANIEVQFGGPIDPHTVGGITLSTGGSTVTTTPVLSNGNTVVKLVPALPLTGNSTYTVTVAGVKDTAGNTVATVTNTFQTAATFNTTPPSLVNMDPPNGDTVGANAVVNLYFNEPLDPISVTASNISFEVNDTSQRLPITVTLSADAKHITIQPQTALLPNTQYAYYLSSLRDQNGNNNSFGWYYFTTSGSTVTAHPTVTVSPLNGSTAVPLNAIVSVVSSADIDPTTWSQSSVQVLDSSSHAVAGAVTHPANNKLVFTPTAALSASATYTVKVSGFNDVNGNSVTSSTTTFTTGTVAATGGLTLVSTSPTWSTSSSNAISNNLQPITLVFSQVLDPSSVNATTVRVMNGWNSGDSFAGTYQVTGNTVVFTPSAPYPAGATIYVGACGGPADVLGEVYQNGGCWYQLDVFVISAGTTDTTALQVVSVTPANGTVNVGLEHSVSVTFNKPINPYTVSNNNNNALLFANNTLVDRGSISMSADDTTLTFNTSALWNGSNYTIELAAGGIADKSGNALASTFTSTFSTISDPATGNGAVQGVAPGRNASGIPSTSLLTLYMNRQVNAASLPGALMVTVNGQVYSGNAVVQAGGWEVQYTPSVAFPAGATVQWFLSSQLMDIYADNFSSDSGVFYMAGNPPDPTTAVPQVVSVSPAYGSSIVPTNAVLDIQYSQPIDATTLSGIAQQGGPSSSYTVSLLKPTVVRITPTTTWNASTWYGFCANTSVKGTNGVNALGDCYMEYFTTTAGPDSTTGTAAIGPPNGSVNVGTNAYIRLQFSKPADRTSVNSSTITLQAGSVAIPFTFTLNYSGSDVVGVNLYPVNPLPASTQITVAQSGVLDYTGTAFTASQSTFTTAATPDYSQATVSFDFPWWATNIGTNASFTCRYSKPMDPSSINQGNTYVYNNSTSAKVPVSYKFSSDLMALVMKPTAALAANTSYQYDCYGGLDLTGNTFSGTYEYFTTGAGPDAAGPVLLTANPPNGFTNVPFDMNQGPWASTSLQLLFNEPVSHNTLSGITLTPQGGSPVPIGTYLSDGDQIVSLTLPYVLLTNTKYTISVQGVADYSGNPGTAATSTFTTGSGYDWSSPSVVSAFPADGSTGISKTTAASVTFSEPMDTLLIDSSHIYLYETTTSTTVPTTMSYSADLKTVTLTPVSALDGNVTFRIYLQSPNWYFYDIAGNYNYYNQYTSFTTAP